MSPIFGQAQKIRLERLNQGLSHVQEAVDNHTLSPPDGQRLLRSIHAQRDPLLQQQQKAEQQAMQKQKQQIMDAHALSVAMEQQAAVARAHGLPDRVAVYTDPLTGKSAHLLETKPGHVEEVKFERAGEEEKMMHEAEAAANTPAPEGPGDDAG